jgi:hypothetical protein
MYSFDANRLPATTLTVDTDDTTGRSLYTATVTITGLEPNRETNTDERVAGITSLDPPTVVSESVQGTIDLAWLACLNSYEASGLEITPTVMDVLGCAVRYSLAECFSQAGIDA